MKVFAFRFFFSRLKPQYQFTGFSDSLGIPPSPRQQSNKNKQQKNVTIDYRGLYGEIRTRKNDQITDFWICGLCNRTLIILIAICTLECII